MSDAKHKSRSLPDAGGTRLWIVVTLLGLCLLCAQGRTLRVRQDGTGDYTTITAAVSAMAGGDTCLVGPGTYAERVRFSTGKSGTAAALTTVKAETKGTVDILGVDTLNCNYLRIEGFNISVTATSGNDGNGVAIRSSNVEVVGNYFHDIHYGSIAGTGNNISVISNRIYKAGIAIVISGNGWLVEGNDVERLQKYSDLGDADYIRFFGSNHIIRNNHLHGTLSSEIGTAHVDGFQTFDDSGGYAQHVRIEGNRIMDFFHEGLMSEATFYSNSFDIVVCNNVFRGAGSWGVLATRGMREVKVYNNLFMDMSAYGVGIRLGSSGEVRNNIFYNVAYYDVDTSQVTGGNNIFYKSSGSVGAGLFTGDQINVNPLFVNVSANNFHLQAGSPAINSGAMISFFNYDQDGVIRPQGTAWDIGPFEYVSALPDTAPPVISAVGAGSVGSFAAAINWTTDEAANSRVEYGLSTGYALSVSNATLIVSHTLILTNLTSSTTYHFRVSSRDGAGNTTNSGDFTFTTTTVDTTAPTVSMTSPTAGVTLSNAITLSASAVDNNGGSGVANVSFLVDGLAVGNDAAGPYSVSWDTRTVVNGTHSIKARAMDGAGNQADSISLSFTVQNSSPTLTDGMILYFPFEEGSGAVTSDLSGSRNHGLVTNGASWQAGKVRGGLLLDGVNDFVRVPASPLLESATNAVSVCAWVRLATNGQWQAVVRKVLQEGTHVSPFSAYDLVTEDQGGTLLPRMAVSRADGTRGLVYGSAPLTYGAWTHLAGVYDGATVRIYVNGAVAGSAAFAGALIQTGQPLLVGRNGIGGDALKGGLDELRVYNRALSAAEVLALFTTTAPAAPQNLRISE